MLFTPLFDWPKRRRRRRRLQRRGAICKFPRSSSTNQAEHELLFPVANHLAKINSSQTVRRLSPKGWRTEELGRARWGYPISFYCTPVQFDKRYAVYLYCPAVKWDNTPCLILLHGSNFKQAPIYTGGQSNQRGSIIRQYSASTDCRSTSRTLLKRSRLASWAEICIFQQDRT